MRLRQSALRGAILLEAVLFTPILLLLLLGMIELARVTYTYYTVQKTLLAVARVLGTQQGVNFCDDADTSVQSAKNIALTGTADGSGTPYIGGLTADQIQVRIERFTAASGDIGECECSATACDTVNGGQSPDYVVVSIPDGYSITLRIPALPLDPILLRPRVRFPFQGT
jgi:Flp pilus assembly protein TadG